MALADAGLMSARLAGAQRNMHACMPWSLRERIGYRGWVAEVQLPHRRVPEQTIVSGEAMQNRINFAASRFGLQASALLSVLVTTQRAGRVPAIRLQRVSS